MSISKEDILIRFGDLVNPIGIFRCAMIYGGKLDRKQYYYIIKKNYLIDVDKELPFYLLNRIEQVWKDSEHFFKGIGILVSFNKDIIQIQDPMDDFYI